MGTRNVILLRHAEYHSGPGAALNLTALGKKQAQRAAKALAREPIDAVWTSTLLRAIETANIVCEALSFAPARTSALLREGFPTQYHGLDVDDSQVAEDRARADRAFAKFFRPSKQDRTELLVCHGNVIRYFVASALRAKPETWTRFITNNCGITRVLIRPTGAVRVVSYNECEHLRPHLLT